MGNGTLPCLHTMIKKSSALPQVPKVPWTLGKHVPRIPWRWRTNSVVGVHTWLSAVACWLAQLSRLSSTFAPLQACSDQEKWVQSHPSGGWTTRVSTGAQPLVPVGLRRYRTATHFTIRIRAERKEKKDNSNIATSVNYGVASFSSWSKCICNTETGIIRNREPSTTTASFQRWTPWTSTNKLAGPGSHMVNWEYSVHPDTPIWSGGPEVIECNRKNC